MEDLNIPTIIDMNIEATRHGNYYLLQMLVSMPATFRPTRYVV